MTDKNIDEVKGRAKEAVGSLTDDKSLKNEGRVDQAKSSVKDGVIDPAMVTRSALQNAASIAKNILTTEAIVAEVPEKEAAGVPGGGMPDMGGMM